jgi:hypothetical protein
MDGGGWYEASDVVGEGQGRQIDQIGALREADGPPGSPVHGNGTIWVSAANHLCRLLGVEMALTKGGSPTSYWQHSDVDVPHLLERKVQTCVARIPAPAGTFNKITERGPAMRTTRVSPAVVVGGQDAYLEAAKLNEVTRLDFTKLQTSSDDRVEQTARACWGNERR